MTQSEPITSIDAGATGGAADDDAAGLHAATLQEERRRLFIHEATALLASSLDYRSTLAQICELAVPRIADWCAVDVIDPATGVVERLAMLHKDPAKVELGRELHRRYPPAPDAPRGLHHVLRTGLSESLSEIPDELLAASARDAAHLQLLRAIGVRSYMVVPLRDGERVRGAISFVNSESPRPLDARDLLVAEELASCAAVALANARLYAEAQEARARADDTARRAAELLDISGELSRAATPEQVADVLSVRGLPLFGACAGALVKLNEATQTLEYVRSTGYRADVLQAYVHIPSDARWPILTALRTGEPQFMETPEEMLAQDPESAAFRSPEHFAWAALPLLAKGRVVGGIALSFPTSRRFTAADRSFMQAICHACAQAMDRAELYEAEQRARTTAELAIHAREDLLAIVSHDLRSPLGAILTSVALLRKLELPPEAAKRATRYADIIARSAQGMNRLIGDLLDLASIESGRIAVESARHLARELFAETIETHAAVAAEKGLSITASGADGLAVRGDRERILQILSNLVGNAIKFTTSGGIALDVEATGSLATFSVYDTGVGIAADALPHVFDRYWQAKRRTRTGLGLGLSIARGLVEAHGGRIWVTSKPGAGSTFFFTLPLDVA